MTRFERVDSPEQSLVFAIPNAGLPSCIYWGTRLPAGEQLEQLALAVQSDVNGGMLDAVPAITVAPLAKETFPGQLGMKLRHPDGRGLDPSFEIEGATIASEGSVWRFVDRTLELQYQLSVEVVGNAFALQASLEAKTPILIEWLAAPVIPAPLDAVETIEFSGRWCGEFQMSRVPWVAGIRLRESRLGRTSHEHFPGLILPSIGCGEASGTARAMHYGWSGGHRMLAEQLPDGRRQVQWGNVADRDLVPSTGYQTSKLYLACSDKGLNGIAEQFQLTVRDYIVDFPDSERPRPVHYNCWEAVYFDHKPEELVEIAERAAALGAERFVLDDGWFLGRNDDTSSLGDWFVDQLKYPQGLTPLIEKVHELGMSFGLWFEPEMVNEDSELFRRNPEWLLGPVDQVRGRQQLVLDMSLGPVRAYLLQRLDALLSEYPIDYIKWDHNRVLPHTDANQARGFYQLVDALRALHPRVEIESCSSGGGRIDFGVLERTHRVWLSDSNDALERFWMQRNAALFLPAVVTGSHVGPRVCHTSGRELPIEFRAWVAATRHMGFEMDPRELTEHEATVLTAVTAWYKSNRDWMHKGTIQRVHSDDPAVLGEMHISQDKDQFALFVAQMEASAQSLPLPVRMVGLDPLVQYKITLVNADQQHGINRAPVALTRDSLELSGLALMSIGVQLPISFPATLWVIKGEKL